MALVQQITEDFKNYLWYAWSQLGLPAPTPVQYELADYLQHGPRRKIIQAFRGVGKSWITSAYCTWCWLVNPNYKILVVSASKQRADDFSTFTLRIIREFPVLTHLIPGKNDRDSKVAFDVRPAQAAHAPSCKSVGVFGMMTGSRADEVVSDDIEIPNNSATQDLRDKLIKTVMEFEAIIMPETGKITYLGTPQTEESVYNKLAERGYSRRIWPARFPMHDEVGIYHGQLAPTIAQRVIDDPRATGEATDPGRFDNVDLSEREASYGRSGFALQFMLDTSLSDAERYPLKTADVIVTSVNNEKAPVSITYGSGKSQQLDVRNVGFAGDRWYSPMHIDEDWIPYTGRAMSIDPSGRGPDETSYAIGLELHGNIYVPEVGGFREGYTDEVLKSLALIAKKYKVNHIIVESNFGDGMFEKLFTPILFREHKCVLEEIRHSTQKELRIIDTLEPSLNQHRLIFDQSVIDDDIKLLEESLNRSLFYQLTRLTKMKGALKHDDRLDALAILVKYWLDVLDQDAIRSKEQWERREVDKELEKFMTQVLGENAGNKRSNNQMLNRR